MEVRELLESLKPIFGDYVRREKSLGEYLVGQRGFTAEDRATEFRNGNTIRKRFYIKDNLEISLEETNWLHPEMRRPDNFVKMTINEKKDGKLIKIHYVSSISEWMEERSEQERAA